ncbi:hypothetical protein SEPCBS119000_005631 [Sporothrix epigloea]|uniref:Transcription factor n=1 Tax=Sporothrix epigloea TaxID=1892477 RepID=A0ABP0DYW3_9PEZI
MQEHIRRAHPGHYISKLPATEESFMLMINTPPSERPPSQQNAGPAHGDLADGAGTTIVNGHSAHNSTGHAEVYQSQTKPFFHNPKHGSLGIPSNSEEFVAGSMPPAASAAAALAQLHSHKPDREWDEGEWISDTEKGHMSHSSIELPPIRLPNPDLHSESFASIGSIRQRELLPSILSNSPPGRSSTLPPLQRHLGSARPRKQSVTKRAREMHHKKQKSRGFASDWLRRIQNDSAVDRLRPGGPLKAMSAEPHDFGKRWEDLIDAAASATEDIDEDRTPKGEY